MNHVVVDLLCFMVMVSFMGGVTQEGKLQGEGEGEVRVRVHVHERELEGGREVHEVDCVQRESERELAGKGELLHRRR